MSRDDAATRFLKWGIVLLIFTAPQLSVDQCYGQVVNATLYGSVSDPTGAAIPGATVAATNVKTGIRTERPSDGTGNYLLPSLPPGTYDLEVKKEGFKSKVISGISLLVDQQARLDVQLEVGQVSTQVEVKGSAPLVTTSTASVGTVVGEREVVDLPLNLRRVTSLATLVPGTISASGHGYASYIVGGSPFSEATYVAGGGRDASNTLLIDGVESRAYDTGGFALAPPPDSVQEFKIQTNVYSAAFGKTAGSTMNLVTKSGTNEYHGSVYEFLRNDKLDARNFFASNRTDEATGSEIPGSARPKYRRNQFGATLGGPIRKNKTFFFADYDALREVKGLTLGNFVPTTAQRQGDLSDALTGTTLNLCGAGGPSNLDYDTGQLFDPASTSLFTCPAGSANAGSTIMVGNPIPGNIITNIDPVAQKVLAGYPLPNRPGYPNYVNQTPRNRPDNQFGVRIDHSFGPKDQLFGRYLFAQSNITDPSAGYTSLPGFGDKIFFRGQNLALGWTRTFGANLLNEARFGFQRNNPDENCENCENNPGKLAGFGINGLSALGPDMEGSPFVSFSGFSGAGDAGYRPISNVEMVEKYEDHLTWIRGRHTIVVGADLQFWQNLRQQNPYSPRGQLSFDGRFSSLAGAIPDVGGVSGLADLLSGSPSGAARTLAYRNVNQVGSTFWSFYGQDDIRLSPALSLNLGLRYEYRANPVDKRDNIVSFAPLGAKFSGAGNGALVTALDDTMNDALCTDPAHSNLVTADGRCLIASSAQRSQLGFTGRTRRTLVVPQKRDFAPRIGLTWRPLNSDKLIVRTGYGIFYDLSNLNTLEFVSGNPVFGPSQIFNTAFGSPPPLTNGVPTTTANVFASAVVPRVSEQYAGLWVTPDFQAPRVQEWSFGIQSQLAQDWGLDVSYVATSGRHLDTLHYTANQPEPGVGDLQARRPYPDFNALAYFSADSNSNYHSLQAKLTKRFSNGLMFLTSYTFAKSTGNAEGNEGSWAAAGQFPQDDNNPGPNYGRTIYDVRHRVVFSPVWELPFGSGRRYLNQRGVVNHILGGWQLSVILSLQSGFPLTILSSQDFSNTGSSSPRPDRTCSGVGKKTLESWYDTGCFTTEALQQALSAGQPRFGNSGRNILDGPGQANFDIGLLKRFSLGERIKVQFRAEAFNFFNHPNFGGPDVSIGSPFAGVIGSAGEPRDIQFGLKVEF